MRGTEAPGTSLQPIIGFPVRDVENPVNRGDFMSERLHEMPLDMRRFIETPVATGFRTGYRMGMMAGVAIAAVLGWGLGALGGSSTAGVAFGMLVALVNGAVLTARYRSHASTPLAVNLNHPFMGDDPIGSARVLVRMSDGTWVDPGPHRVRTTRDELMGGLSLIQDTDDYPVIGHFHKASEKTPLITRHLALINQAIALRDAVNNVPDPIDGARQREDLDTGLLERSWLEEEEGIEVESPLVGFFRQKE